jgi:hypothetical protein
VTPSRDVRSHPRRCAPLLRLGLALPLGLLLAPLQGDAQIMTRTGVGWVGAVPEALLGIGAFHYFGDSAWGVYADTKLTHDSRARDPDFESGLTVAELEQDDSMRWIHPFEDFLMFNLGLIRDISPEFAFVLAGGAARKRTIVEFAEVSFIEGDPDPQISRILFVEDEEESGWEPNFAVNGLMRAGEQVLFSAGFELAPRAISLGIFVVFR